MGLPDHPGRRPCRAGDDLFFVYDKDRLGTGGKADKIRSWVNLSTTDATAVGAAVTTALGTPAEAAGIDQQDQFAWWKDSANKKHNLSYADDKQYGGDILDDADNTDRFRVKQITYPSCSTCSRSRTTRTRTS